MKKILYSLRYFFVIFLIVSVVIIYLFYQVLQPKNQLPIYSPSEMPEKLVDSTIRHIKKNHKIIDFNLTNQIGKPVSLADLKDKIQVVDFFFTTCPGICPILTKNMEIVQQETLKDPKVSLLSISVTPEIDDVAKLQEYAKEHHVNIDKWQLLTGSRKQIYDLTRKSYLVAEYKPKDTLELIHSQNFVLVDTQRRIRGYYDGTDNKSIQKLLADIEILKNE